ncbi:hypothetical protein FGO68_gene9810 [Halteria grandinella]|uniref:Uncharacterized protein n=1 Tax=Halteria grandinella TaxID=5974 RepID=A0A8J8NJA3_HALGN|nr:hypothetical protein FGO68_gene9810 [Halteria grandinella]
MKRVAEYILQNGWYEFEDIDIDESQTEFTTGCDQKPTWCRIGGPAVRVTKYWGYMKDGVRHGRWIIYDNSGFREFKFSEVLYKSG